MRVLLRYNGWSKFEDVPERIVRSGVICFSVTPPLALKPCSEPIPDKLVTTRICLYATNKATDLEGYPVFENDECWKP